MSNQLSARQEKAVQAIMRTHGDVKALTCLAISLSMVLAKAVDEEDDAIFDGLLQVAIDTADLYNAGYRPGEEHA